MDENPLTLTVFIFRKKATPNANNRQLHPDEKQHIKQLANGDPTKEARLTAAACAVVNCYAEYPVDSAAYKQLKQLADIGNSPELAGERQQLASQSGLFNYTTNKAEVSERTMPLEWQPAKRRRKDTDA